MPTPRFAVYSPLAEDRYGARTLCAAGVAAREVVRMAPPRIEAYRFGRMVVDGTSHTRDLILLPDRVIGNWWRKEGHRLIPDDLEPVLGAAPEVLVVGTGAFGRMKVTEETRKALEEAGIELVVANTGEAVQRYNDLRERRRTAGAFHLTC